MAYAQDPTQQDPQAQQQAPLNQPPTTGGSVGGTAPQGSKTPNQPSRTNAPAPFTNLQSYLNVNAPQIQGMADTVSGQLGNQYGQAKGAIDTASQNFGTQVNAGYAAPNQTLVNQAAANPTEFAKDQTKVQAFQKQYNDQYSGPAKFETTPDYTSVQGDAQNAVNQAQNIGNYSGLQSYLTKNVESNPTQAMSALDTALINQSPGAMQTISTAAKPMADLGNYLQTLVTQNNALATNAQQTAQQAKQYAQDKFTGAGGVVPTFQKSLADQFAQAQSGATAQETQLKADLATGDAAKIGADLSKFNLQPGQAANISDYLTALNRDYGKNIDLSNALNFNPVTDITQANVATQADYAKAAALGQLTGGQALLNPADASKAGTWNQLGNSLNVSDVNSGLRNALIQSEEDKLNAPPADGGGSSSPGKSKTQNLADYMTKGAGALAMPAAAGAKFTGEQLSKGLNSIGNSISKALFGGSHKDAAVNLPQFSMPDMGVPSKANAATMEKITDAFNKPLSTAGSYHEGVVGDLVSRLSTLKQALGAGQLTQDEYNAMSKPLAQYAQQAAQVISGASSQAANSVRPGLTQLQEFL